MLLRSDKMIKNILDRYVSSYPYEIISTMIVILVILLKLFTNQQISRLKLKRTVVSFPGEITVLVLGFLFSDMINYSNKSESIISIIILIIIALIIILSQYAFEKWIDNKLSGNIKWNIISIIVFMYIISILFYIVVVFGR